MNKKEKAACLAYCLNIHGRFGFLLIAFTSSSIFYTFFSAWCFLSSCFRLCVCYLFNIPFIRGYQVSGKGRSESRRRKKIKQNVSRRLFSNAQAEGGRSKGETGRNETSFEN